MINLNDELERFEFIEAGIKGLLSGKKKEIFELLLESDQAFAQEVRYTRMAMEATQLYQKEKQQLAAMARQKRQRLLIKTAATLAALLLLGLAAAWWLYLPAAALYQEVALEQSGSQLQPYPCNNQEKSQQAREQHPAVAFYFQCNYQACIEACQQQTPASAEVIFYAANAHLALGHYREAQQYFKKVIAMNRESAKMYHISSWYFSLLSLEMNDVAPAEASLSQTNPDTQMLSALENKLLLYYIKNNQIEEAEQVLQHIGGHWKLRLQLKLLKWTK